MDRGEYVGPGIIDEGFSIKLIQLQITGNLPSYEKYRRTNHLKDLFLNESTYKVPCTHLNSVLITSPGRTSNQGKDFRSPRGAENCQKD